MNINNLIAINHLQEPYTIKVGDKLKIANSSSFSKKARYKSNTIYRKPQKTSTRHTSTDNFIWPIKGKIISTFGHKSGGLYNDGINIQAQNNDPVKVVKDGVVAYVGNELRGYGNLIIVKHSGNWISAYAHLNKLKVKQGDKVTKGNIIATIGSTGNVDHPQLYFGIRKGREAVNPEKHLRPV
jgi:murein DD-endopeptidase MepM/ murein hydrolase activator NlpD